MSNNIKCENISAGYGKKIILEDASFEVAEGEILAVIGPNGAGKSTLLKALTKELDVLGGAVYIGEKNIREISQKVLSKEVSAVSTEKAAGDYMRVYDMVAAGRYPYTGVMGILSEEDEKAVKEIIDLANLNDIRWNKFDELSDGQKQRVIIARALCREPRVLILDEPTSFLDIRHKFEILSLVRKLADQKKISVIMSMHELDLVKRFADKTLAIKDGKPDKYGKDILSDEYIRELFDISKNFLIAKKASSYAVKRRKKARVIMVQGTMSGAGKSIVAAGLCRVFKQDGYRVCPFKSQNMALNSYITEEGLEMGRAQVMQAQAAKIKPSSDMNPVLLKPTTDVGSQVIVNGKSIGNMSAREYFSYKKKLMPEIMKAFYRLEESFDIIVIEGAGSPAEINLKENDIVNMGLAKETDAPVILVADIDRGGVFAQLKGTVDLLEEDEKSRVEGFVINKFRGDPSLLDSGTDMLKELTDIDTVGLIPYTTLSLDDEDSLSDRFLETEKKTVDIAVIRLPKISNFTDFHPFEIINDVGIRYVSSVKELSNPDMIIIPGTKNTIEDLRWLKDSGLFDKIKEKAAEGLPVFGICGGYQMLCERIRDDVGAETGGAEEGMGLLRGNIVFKDEKLTKQTDIVLGNVEGIFSALSGKNIKGYEIHMGVNTENDEALAQRGNVYGTFIHGFFDNENTAGIITSALADKKGVKIEEDNAAYEDILNEEYDKLADVIRNSVDIKALYEIMEKYYED
ncbi:MAG: cobyric acid synthase [Eubacterium sp.]|nr:cobyric acid synthase [Eubacterium sp.]